MLQSKPLKEKCRGIHLNFQRPTALSSYYDYGFGIQNCTINEPRLQLWFFYQSYCIVKARKSPL